MPHVLSLQPSFKLPLANFRKTNDISEQLYRHDVGFGIDLSYAARIRKASPFFLTAKIGFDLFPFDRRMDEGFPQVIDWSGQSTKRIRSLLGVTIQSKQTFYVTSGIFVGGAFIFDAQTVMISLSNNGILKQAIHHRSSSFNLCIEAHLGFGIQCTDRLSIDVGLSVHYSNAMIRSEISEIFSLPFSNQLINPIFTNQNYTNNSLLSVLYLQMGIQFNYRFFNVNQ